MHSWDNPTMLLCLNESPFLMENKPLPYAEIRRQLIEGRQTCLGLVQQYLKQIDAFNAEYNVFLEVYREEALAQAQLIDQKIKLGHAGKLAGMVIGIKDLLTFENHGSQAGSQILNGFKSTFTGTAVQRLLDEDAIIIGRQNCDEFGMGSTNENSSFGPVLNFANKKHVAGGSSGGSAVAVQAGMCHLSIGTDTGGSIRMPAAFCGVSGLKPTYGLVSRWGLIAYASSFDTIGPMGHFVEDLALTMSIMAGPDEQDSTVVSAPIHLISSTRKLAYIKEIVEHASLQEEIREAFFEQVEKFKKQGYEVDSVDFPYIDQMLPTYYVLTTAEASSNLSRFDGVKFGHRTEHPKDLMDLYKKTRDEGFGEEVKRRIMLGTFVLSADYYDAYYTKAQKVRRLIQEYTDQILAEYDFIISPTTSSTAYAIGEKTADPLQMYLGDLFTVQANVTGLPALSVPMGLDAASLPMGFQFMGPRFSENALIDIASLIKN
jgi:aspartyl-tRNA(Asn)/glutamyl-tRNA(Gln) amidotransferase subunit A